MRSIAESRTLMSVLGQRQSFRFLAADGAVVARQGNDELSECAGLGVDIDAAALTMISCVIDRPSPVPSPVGLVVKKGLNIFALTSGEMPVPLSRIRISTVSPRSLVVALRTGSKVSSSASALRLSAA